MKSILISIKPKYVADILNGKKTLEIRKSMPKCELPIDVYIYCTKVPLKEQNWLIDKDNKGNLQEPYGKVVAKFTLNKVKPCYEFYIVEICQLACISQDELYKYADGWWKTDDLYAWHIDNLVIFDEPKELSEFRTCFNDFYKRKPHPLMKAPQSWQFVEINHE